MSNLPPPSNDNVQSRRIRDGLSKKWEGTDLGAMATEDSLLRLAAARNESSTTANRFMLFGALCALLYFLKLEGIASDVKYGEYSLKNIPFGLFVTSVFGLILATVALIRIGDSRGFDRQLRLACEKRYAPHCHAHYAAFPNTTAFGEGFSMISSVVQAGKVMSLVRTISLFLVTIFISFLIVAPAITGTHYLMSGLYTSEGGYEKIRWWLTCALILTNLSTLILTVWVRLVDEG